MTQAGQWPQETDFEFNIAKQTAYYSHQHKNVYKIKNMGFKKVYVTQLFFLNSIIDSMK